MIKVMTVFGTRPEAIKWHRSRNYRNMPTAVETVVAVTAQHRQMLDQVLELFRITPDYDLDIMAKAKPCTILRRSAALLGLKDVLAKKQPDLVSFTVIRRPLPVPWLRIISRSPSAGQAGLRTGDIYSPFPEDEPQAHWDHGVHSLCTDLDGGTISSENVNPSQIYV